MHIDTRSFVGKLFGPKGRCDLYKLILETLDAGLTTPTNSHYTMATLRILFPDAPPAYAKSFKLTNSLDRAKVRTEILPALVERKAEFLANPGDIENIVARYHRQHVAAVAEARPAQCQTFRNTAGRAQTGNTKHMGFSAEL
jgi:hypothetical protein